MNNIDVSILVPVYNVEAYIDRCLKSIGEQTYKGTMECVLIDDCGTDKSMEISAKFIEAYSGRVHFRIIHHEYNRGLAAARNTAVESANGRFVMHVDSDDWIEKNAVDLLMQKQAETDADIVSGNAIQHLGTCDKLLCEPSYSTPVEMTERMIKISYDHVIWRRLIRRNLYTDNSIRNVEGINIGEDHQTMPRLAFVAKKVAVIDGIVYHYNCNNDSSYMAKTKKTYFSYPKFESDIKAFRILEDFFIVRDSDIYEKIIKERYDYYKRSEIFALRDYSFSAFKAVRKSSQMWSNGINEFFGFLTVLFLQKSRGLISRLKNIIPCRSSVSACH